MNEEKDNNNLNDIGDIIDDSLDDEDQDDSLSLLGKFTMNPEDEFYQYVHILMIDKKKNKVKRDFFRRRIKDDHELSCDWCKLTKPPWSPDYTKNRHPEPDLQRVIAHLYSRILKYPNVIKVVRTKDKHDPKNKAHCDIRFDVSKFKDFELNMFCDALADLVEKKIWD